MTTPRVSVGVPVFNGELFLAETLDSLLGQTFTDFEIIISDNASTDRTEEIARSYAAQDPRIRYVRHGVNRGSAWNHNQCVAPARGEFFKWNSADDLCAPEFLTRCVAALESDPEAVLACTSVAEIDAGGNRVAERSAPEEVASRDPYVRFRRQMDLDHLCQHVYGLMRTRILRQTDLIGPYTDSDRVLLVHMSLFGHFKLIPEPLLMNRDHPHRFSRTYKISWRERMEWFDPSTRGQKVFPFWQELSALWRVVGRSPLRWRDRLRCYRAVLGWPHGYQRALIWELQYYPKQWIVRHVPGSEAALSWIRRMRESRGAAQ